MTTPEPSGAPAGSSARIVVRDVLGAAWPLFQVSLPTCLPLAVVAVAASGIPGAEAAANGEAHGYLHSHDWWSVTIASTVLVLICYGAMLRQQLALAGGARPQLPQSLRDAARDLPFVLVIIAAWVLPFLPAMLCTAWRGFDVMALLLTALAAALAVYMLPAWPAMLAGSTNPSAALATSIRLVRGRWLQFVGVVATLLAMVLIYLLLASIFINMVMSLVGQGINPTAGGLAFSRWLIAIVQSVTVVYAGAVAITTWRVAASGSQR